MAGSEIRDLVMKLRLDASEAEAQLKRLKAEFDKLGQGGFGGGSGGGSGSSSGGGGKAPSGAGFEEIAKAFEAVSKTGKVAVADIASASNALKLLEKAGLDTKGGLTSVQQGLATLSKTGVITAADAAKLGSTFDVLGQSGIKTGGDLQKLTAISGGLAKEQEQLTTKSIATGVAIGNLLSSAVEKYGQQLLSVLPEMLKFGGEITNITQSFEGFFGGAQTAGTALEELRGATQGVPSL